MLVIATVVAVAIPSPSDAQLVPLKSRLTQRLERAPLDRNLWGIAVLDGSGRLLFGWNAERLFMPASNAKLAVTAAALALLDPDQTVTTSVYAAGPTAGEVIQGNLVLYGRGDPTWGRRCFTADTLSATACVTDPFLPLARLASQLRALGIRRVDGDIVGDGSYFESETLHPTWEHDDLAWGYASPVTGLGFNENSLTLTIVPGLAIGDSARVSVFPPILDLRLTNNIRTVSDSGGTMIDARYERDGRLVLDGRIRINSAPRREEVAVQDPNHFAAVAFRQVLVDSGIAVLGMPRGVTDSADYAAARSATPLAETASRPIRDWIFPILNVSNNWYAEMLLKQLGRARAGGGRWRDGLAVERRFLIDSVGIDSTQFLLHDGSGLSAKNLMSPLALAKILAFMRGHPRFGAFGPALAQSGRAGSLATRFTSTTLAGRVRGKTGTMGQVNTLSGYIERRSDATSVDRRPLRVFSVMANHHTLGSRAMADAIDSLVIEIGRQ